MEGGSPAAVAHPLVDFTDLEAPDPAGPVGWEVFALNPTQNRVLGDLEVPGDFGDG